MNPFGDSDEQFLLRLRQEVEAWEQAGTITAEQGQAILDRYPAADSLPGAAARKRQALVVGLSILGAALVGLGIITFFAANWDDIPKSVRLAVLVAGVALSYGAGYYLWQRAGYVGRGRGVGPAGLHHLRGRGASRRPGLPHPGAPSQPDPLLVLGRAPPSLRYTLTASDVSGHSPVPGRRRIPAGALAGTGFGRRSLPLDHRCLSAPWGRCSTPLAGPRNRSTSGSRWADFSAPSGYSRSSERFTC